jgi:hypothetical protein
MNSFESHGWNAERESLETALLEAANKLLAHTEADGMEISRDGVKVALQLIAEQRRSS